MLVVPLLLVLVVLLSAVVLLSVAAAELAALTAAMRTSPTEGDEDFSATRGEGIRLLLLLLLLLDDDEASTGVAVTGSAEEGIELVV